MLHQLMELIGFSVALQSSPSYVSVASAWKPDVLSAGPRVSRSTSESICCSLAAPPGWRHHLVFLSLAAASGQVQLPSASGQNSSNFQVSSWPHLPSPVPEKNNDFLATASRMTNSGPLWSRAGGLSSCLAQMYLNDILFFS